MGKLIECAIVLATFTWVAANAERKDQSVTQYLDN